MKYLEDYTIFSYEILGRILGKVVTSFSLTKYLEEYLEK
jgi:hypothetical protein